MTISPKPEIVRVAAPEVFQIFTVLSRPEVTKFPFLSKSTERVPPPCAVVDRTCLPLNISQVRTVPSSEAEASILESARQDKEVISCLCPFRV